MGSLKALTKTMAGELGLTPAALYERQRVLVAANLLKPEKGRGPGSGVRATPKSVAWLLISVLAAQGLSDVEESAPLMARLKLSGSERGPLDWETTFVDALAWALSSPANASKVTYVHVEITRKTATVHFVDRAKPKIVGFGRWHRILDLEFSAALRGEAVQRIADQLYAMVYGEGVAR